MTATEETTLQTKCPMCGRESQVRADKAGLNEFPKLKEIADRGLHCDPCTRHHNARSWIEKRISLRCADIAVHRRGKSDKAKEKVERATKDLSQTAVHWIREECRFFRLGVEWRDDPVLRDDLIEELIKQPHRWGQILSNLVKAMQKEHSKIYGEERKEHTWAPGLRV